MVTLSRRAACAALSAAAAFGLNRPLRFVPAAGATPLEPTVGFYKFKVGSVEVTAVYDGIWRKPHDPAFIKDVTVDETKEALAKAGLTTEFMPIPLTVFVLKIGDRYVMCDAGSGVGQWQANATHLPANMAAAGIDHTKIDTILISHFHPDHVWGLMEKGTNAPMFPNAELVVNGTEYGGGPTRRGSGSCRRAAGPRASASRTCSRPGRTGGWSRTAPRSRPASSLSPRPATRPATPSSWSPPAGSS